jgi:hypothetical protein
MGERHSDALVTVFTGQLSGWYFLPSFNRLSDGFFAARVMHDAQDLRCLGRVTRPPSVIDCGIAISRFCSTRKSLDAGVVH